MRALAIKHPIGPDGLAWANLPEPTVGPHQVGIQVKAVGINRADLLQTYGKYPPPPGVADVPGLEISGVVAVTGKLVKDFHTGDAVCALLPGAGWADLVAVHAGSVAPLPPGYSWAEGACLMEAALTAFQALQVHGALAAGETALIHAGASGVGASAIRMARLMGAQVIATAGSPEKTRFCEVLGAHLAINYRETDFAPAVKEFTRDQGADVVLDFIGAAYARANLQALATGGRWLLLGLLGGAQAEIDLSVLLRKHIRLISSTLRSRSDAYKAQLTAEFLAAFGPHLRAGSLKTPVYQIFSSRELADALKVMESNKNMGKMAAVWNAPD